MFTANESLESKYSMLPEVIHDWMAVMCKMNSDLMLPASDD